MKPDYFFTQHLEPFGEPRTIPGGWDLSGMNTHQPKMGGEPQQPAQTVGQPEKPQTEAPAEKFPKVSTMPACWDLSHLL